MIVIAYAKKLDRGNESNVMRFSMGRKIYESIALINRKALNYVIREYLHI